MNRTQSKDDVTTSFQLSVETLEKVRKTSRRLGINSKHLHRFATIAALRRYAEGADL